jgi:hypothetical protein
MSTSHAWELRIALSLVRLRLKQGRASDAKNILAPVYRRFTEGFAIADMQTARALLDSLPERLSSRSASAESSHREHRGLDGYRIIDVTSAIAAIEHRRGWCSASFGSERSELLTFVQDYP